MASPDRRRLIIMSCPRSRARGGAGLTIIAALRSPTAATAARTAFIFCRSTERPYATRFQPADEPNARQMRIVLDSVFHGDRKELYNTYRMGQLLGSPLPQAGGAGAGLVGHCVSG